jgi:hypothetical protein
VSKLLPMPKPHLEQALRQLHADYQARMVATSSWGASGDSGEAGREFLEQISAHFWELVPGGP